MTNSELVQLLEDRAKEYRKIGIESIRRNKHMLHPGVIPGSLSEIDNILVDFINYIALAQGMDLGLRVSDFVVEKIKTKTNQKPKKSNPRRFNLRRP